MEGPIYRNKALNYGYIAILTIIVCIFIFNIVVGKFAKYLGNIKLSDFNIKMVLILAVVITYISIVAPSFKILAENQILSKTPPRGNKGIRGSRGKEGGKAACKECGDELCYKKMLFNITKTINFWRQENGMKLFKNTYIIENEYIKDKVKKHCASSEFKKLLTKFGSNNRGGESCPSGIKYCGAYDYMFKMWSIWILIILRYKNGLLFLQSPGLNEADFPGMIEKEDAFQIGNGVTYDDGSGSAQSGWTIRNNIEFPFFDISRNSGQQQQQIYINKLRPTGGPQWSDMFNEVNGSDVKTKIDKLNKIIYDQNVTPPKYVFKMLNSSAVLDDPDEDADFEFVKTIGEVPGGGLVTPFNEIKKYASWYWGSDPAIKPQKVLDTVEKNDVCLTCANSSLCTKDSSDPLGIKVKFSNSYRKLVGEEELSRLDGTASTSAPSGFSIFRPIVIEDLEESSPFFRFYKPVGDVFIKNNNFEETNNEFTHCLPHSGNYEDELLTPIINGAGSKSGEITAQVGDVTRFNYLDNNANNHIYTLLVSGDTKPPIDFEQLYTINNSSGINRNFEALTIWKPIAESGYMALGCVIDTRPYNGVTPPQPPRDSIATIPINSLPNDYYDNTDFDDTNLSGTPHISKFNTLWDSRNFTCDGTNCNEISTIICKTKDEVSVSNPTAQVTGTRPQSNINPQFKNKKYSIQKIYDNNNE